MAVMIRTCEIDGCSGKLLARGMCSMHYQRWNAERQRTNPCGCGCGELTSRRFVHGHHTRLFTPEEQARRSQRNKGDKQRDRGACTGTYRKVGGRHEHRVIMEQIVGRPLGPDEIVHHINHEIRDNRPENLQLTNRSDHARHHLHGDEIAHDDAPTETP